MSSSTLCRRQTSRGYKARLAGAGVRLKGRVLCAYDGYLSVECSGRMIANGKTIKASWDLQKRTPTRAKLTWTFDGPGVFEFDSAIVAPRDIGASRF